MTSILFKNTHTHTQKKNTTIVLPPRLFKTSSTMCGKMRRLALYSRLPWTFVGRQDVDPNQPKECHFDRSWLLVLYTCFGSTYPVMFGFKKNCNSRERERKKYRRKGTISASWKYSGNTPSSHSHRSWTTFSACNQYSLNSFLGSFKTCRNVD